MSDTSHKESKWHPHLDMSFLGCVLAFAMEVYFEEHIFIPWICPYISRHLLSLNPLLACCRRYSRGER